MSVPTNVTASGNLVSSLPYIRWALAHAADLPKVLAGCRAVKAADGLEPKWAAFKASGDNIVAVLGDFPNIDELLHSQSRVDASLAALATAGTLSTLSEANVAAVAGEFYPEKLGDGALLKLIFENLPMIVETVLKIVGLFSG